MKTADPSDSVAPGDLIDYTITITNPTPQDLSISHFLDLIPENTSYVSGTLTLSPFVPDVLWYSQGVVFNTGDLLLPASGSTVIRFSARVDSGTAPGTQIVNRAYTDHGPSNETLNSVAAEAELYYLLDVDPPGLATPGGPLTYTLTLFNFGYAAADGVQIAGTLSELTDFEAGSIELTGATGVVGYHAPTRSVRTDAAGLSLGAGSVATLTFQARVHSPLPDDSLIQYTMTVNGLATNTVQNFTKTLSDYVDLETTAGNVVVTDTDPSDLTGFALAGCDFDDDGKGDLIIGDPTAFVDDTRQGVVHIVYGGFGLSGAVELPDTGAFTTQIYPPVGTELFGVALATGDFTGDGLDDILIGAPGTNSPVGLGQAFVIEGGGFTNVIDLSTASARCVVTGADNEYLGRSVAAGDFNGDGVDDLILAGPQFAPQASGYPRGRVWVVRGGAGLPAAVNLSAPPAGTSVIVGDPADNGIASNYFGVETPLAAGDLNGDHRDDVVIGAPLAPTPDLGGGLGGPFSGKVFVVRGASAPVALDLADRPSGWIEIQSHFPDGRFGHSVTVGDFNGDGFDDAAAGLPLASWVLTPGDVVYSRAGVVVELPGRSDLGDGTVNLSDAPPGMVTLFGFDTDDRLGFAVAAGDYNRDGMDDLLMGAPFGRNFHSEFVGTAYLLLGSQRLRPQYLLPFWTPGILRFFADSGSQSAFRSLAVGDLNTDGFADLFLGDFVFDPPLVDDGDEVHVFFGKPRAPRIDLAVCAEFGVADRTINPGEQLVLQFDQDVVVTPGPIQATDFYLSNAGASLGAEARLVANPNDPSQAVIILGNDFSNLNINGFRPDTSTYIDIGAGIRQGLIRGARNRLDAEDNGFINDNDLGVDLLWVHATVGTTIHPGTGGSVQVPGNADSNRPDLAYTAHRLNIPPNAITSTTQFGIGRPPTTLSTLGLRNAVQILEDAPGVPSFSTPAALTLQYREEDLSFTPGGVEALFRIYEVVPAGTAARLAARGVDSSNIRRLQTGQELRPVPGAQTVDTSTNTVTVTLDSLSPSGVTTTPGVFATLPVNPVEERTVTVGPTSGASVLISTQSVIQPGTGGAYTLHAIDIPNFGPVPPGTPGSFQIRLRSANLFERSFTSAPTANRFPAQSGAIFAVETRNSAGALAAFPHPVHLRVQFIDRPADADTDVVDFSSARRDPLQMRIVRTDYAAETGVNYQFIDRPQSVDTAAGTVTASDFTGLTGASGIAAYGAVADTSVTPVSADRLIDFLLGRTTFTQAERTGADFNGDGAVDIADVVTRLGP